MTQQIPTKQSNNLQSNNNFTIDDNDEIGYQNQLKDHNDNKKNNQSTTKQNIVQRQQQNAQDETRIRFSQLHPAQQKVVKNGALEFDIKLGWIPKAQITGPIPIAFAHPDVDDLLLQNIQQQSIVYLGYRPTNSFDIHKKFYNDGQNYPFNQFHLCKSQFLQRFFKKYYSDYQFNSTRKFGMILQNSPLKFDSFFQGGNLDAVYLEQNQYRLMTRVDTNTRGHNNYYYFKIKCNIPGKYIFRIVNLSKPKSLYQRGMRPFIKTKQNPIWTQGCTNVRYGLSKLCTQYQLSHKMYSLKFQYQFKYVDETVQFCYGIPYTYTDLISNLSNFRLNPNLHLNKLCYTLSGLEIPLITITQLEKQQKQNNNKYVIGISARVHPGQTHGSHILNGFIKFLLSNKPQAVMLRKNIIFKIIPMINPDGVVIGNTRTSISGKDLNRVYSDKTDFVFPQIIGVRDYTIKLKQKYGDKFLFFIDIHGHSTRKNSFFFGPQYPVFDEQYPKCRLLPKIFANITDIFRYYSCKFRLSSFKQKTCRGYFNSNNIVRTYTFQTSMHSYFNFQLKKDTQFTQSKLQQLGQSLMKSIHGYVNIAVKLEPNKIPQPIDNKKLIIRNKQIKNQQQQNSDQMQSDKADSQDSTDDFNKNQLQIFFNRINQNRQYFYEELMEFNNKPFVKIQKKKKKDNSIQEDIYNQLIVIKQPVAVQQSFQKHTKTKSQWIPRHQFTLRKKQFISYEKLSNVIFGGHYIESIPSIKNHLLYTSSKPSVQMSKSKYTFFNPSFQIQTNKSHLKTSDLKHESKSRFFNQKQQVSSKSNFKQPNRSKPISPIKMHQQQAAFSNSSKKYVTIQAKNKFLLDKIALQKIILEPKNLSILAESESKRSLKEQNRQINNKQSFGSTSLRVLPRKKSIKSFRNQHDKINKKVVKNMSEKGLATKLPYIDRAISKI